MNKENLVGKNYKGKGIVIDYDSSSITIKDTFGRIKTIKDGNKEIFNVPEIKVFYDECDNDGVQMVSFTIALKNESDYDKLNPILEKYNLDPEDTYLCLKFYDLETEIDTIETGNNPDDWSLVETEFLKNGSSALKKANKEIILEDGNDNVVECPIELVITDNTISNEEYEKINNFIYKNILNQLKEEY